MKSSKSKSNRSSHASPDRGHQGEAQSEGHAPPQHWIRTALSKHRERRRRKQLQASFYNQVRITPLSCDGTCSTRSDSSSTVFTEHLSLTLGRKNLSQYWWQACQQCSSSERKHGAPVRPCRHRCRPVVEHCKSLPRVMVELTTSGKLQVACEDDKKKEWIRVVCTNKSNSNDTSTSAASSSSTRCYTLFIGETGKQPWMVFQLELLEMSHKRTPSTFNDRTNQGDPEKDDEDEENDQGKSPKRKRSNRGDEQHQPENRSKRTKTNSPQNNHKSSRSGTKRNHKPKQQSCHDKEESQSTSNSKAKTKVLLLPSPSSVVQLPTHHSINGLARRLFFSKKKRELPYNSTDEEDASVYYYANTKHGKLQPRALVFSQKRQFEEEGGEAAKETTIDECDRGTQKQLPCGKHDDSAGGQSNNDNGGSVDDDNANVFMEDAQQSPPIAKNDRPLSLPLSLSVERCCDDSKQDMDVGITYLLALNTPPPKSSSPTSLECWDDQDDVTTPRRANYSRDKGKQKQGASYDQLSSLSQSKLSSSFPRGNSHQQCLTTVPKYGMTSNIDANDAKLSFNKDDDSVDAIATANHSQGEAPGSIASVDCGVNTSTESSVANAKSKRKKQSATDASKSPISKQSAMAFTQSRQHSLSMVHSAEITKSGSIPEAAHTMPSLACETSLQLSHSQRDRTSSPSRVPVPLFEVVRSSSEGASSSSSQSAPIMDCQQDSQESSHASAQSLESQQLFSNEERGNNDAWYRVGLPSISFQPLTLPEETDSSDGASPKNMITSSPASQEFNLDATSLQPESQQSVGDNMGARHQNVAKPFPKEPLVLPADTQASTPSTLDEKRAESQPCPRENNVALNHYGYSAQASCDSSQATSVLSLPCGEMRLSSQTSITIQMGNADSQRSDEEEDVQQQTDKARQMQMQRWVELQKTASSRATRALINMVIEKNTETTGEFWRPALLDDIYDD